MKTLKPEELSQQLAKGNLASSVYLLYGEEDYLIEQSLRQIESCVLTTGMEDFNRQVFSADECSGAEVVNAARMYPMGASQRLVLVRRVQQFKDSNLKALLGYIGQPSPTAVLVLEGNTDLTDKAWIKKLGPTVTGVRFYRLFDDRAKDWIRRRVVQAGYQIDAEAVAALFEFTGSDLRILDQELGKIFAFLDQTKQGKKITAAHVSQITGHFRQFSGFELLAAIGQKNMEKSWLILNRLLADGDHPLMILGLIASQLRQLWQLQEWMATGMTFEEAGQKLKLWPKKLAELRPQLKIFSLFHIQQMFPKLLACDQKLKSSATVPQLVLEMLIYDFVTTR